MTGKNKNIGNTDKGDEQKKSVDSNQQQPEAGKASAAAAKPEPAGEKEPSTLKKRAARASEDSGDSRKQTSSANKQHLPEPLDIQDIPVAGSKRKKHSFSLVSLLLTVLLLAALAGGGYYGWRYVQQYIVQDDDKLAPLLEQLGEQTKQLEQLQQQLDQQLQGQQQQSGQQQAELEQRLQTDRQQLDELQRRVTSQGSRLRDLSTTTRDDWLLAEAEYLLRLASQRLLTERTTANPVALLETVDNILKDFDDPELFAVRRQIASDITRLKISATTDREGIYLQLNALAEAIPQLQLLVKATGDDDLPAAQVGESPEQANGLGDKIASNFGKFTEGLQSYIRIRQRDKPLEPLLGIEEEMYLRHNLRVMLEQAQLALLREEPKIYRASLQKCRQWLQQYFELNQASNVLIEQLSELSDEVVTRQLPEISSSLQALRNYINIWHLRHEGSQADVQQDVEQ